MEYSDWSSILYVSITLYHKRHCYYTDFLVMCKVKIEIVTSINNLKVQEFQDGSIYRTEPRPRCRFQL